MKFIGYKNPDPNGLITADLILIGVNNDQTPEQVLASIDPTYNARIFDESEFPAHLGELPFWKYDGVSIQYDLEMYREAVRNRLRSERQPLLEKLDVAFMMALEEGASTQEIILEKKRLRDITSLADTVNTIDELRSLKVQS